MTFDEKGSNSCADDPAATLTVRFAGRALPGQDSRVMPRSTADAARESKLAKRGLIVSSVVILLAFGLIGVAAYVAWTGLKELERMSATAQAEVVGINRAGSKPQPSPVFRWTHDGDTHTHEARSVNYDVAEGERVTIRFDPDNPKLVDAEDKLYGPFVGAAMGSVAALLFSFLGFLALMKKRAVAERAAGGGSGTPSALSVARPPV